MVQFVVAHDAIHENITKLPAGQACGYTTGSSAIQWTAADFAAHLGAVRICQDAGATDTTADVLDVERGAATNNEVAAWAKEALANFDSAKRPGQRKPAIYTSLNNVPAVVQALKAGGATASLWLADWNLSENQSIADLTTALDGIEITGVQYTDKGVFYDSDVFASAWLTDVSRVKPPVVRHVATGKESLVTVARNTHMTVSGVVNLTATYASEENLVKLARYLAGGNWSLLRRSGAKRAMPKGLVYYTI
jgi:hypothetical protein